MIEHVWTVFCSQSVIDIDSKNISLHNVLVQVTISDEPTPTGVLPSMFELVTLWARADFDVPCWGCGRWIFVSPSGPVGDPVEYDIDLSNYRRHRQRSRFTHLPLREPGRHVFRVELQNEGDTTWHQVAAIPLEVVFETPEIEPAGE